MDTARRGFQLHWVDRDTGEIMGPKLARAKFLEHFANRLPSPRCEDGPRPFVRGARTMFVTDRNLDDGATTRLKTVAIEQHAPTPHAAPPRPAQQNPPAPSRRARRALFDRRALSRNVSQVIRPSWLSRSSIARPADGPGTQSEITRACKGGNTRRTFRTQRKKRAARRPGCPFVLDRELRGVREPARRAPETPR